MKVYIKSTLFFAILFFHTSPLLSQSCILEDPLFNYMPEVDLCCGVPFYSVCYDMTVAESTLGHINVTGPFKFLKLEHPEGVWEGEYRFLTYQELATLMTDVCREDNVFTEFIWDASSYKICGITTNSDFGILKLEGSLPSPFISDQGSSLPTIEIDPIITPIDCPVTEPDISDILDPSSASIPNQAIFDGDIGTVMTHDIMNGVDESTPGPDANTVGILLNALAESGALEYGACFNFNCLDIESMAAGLNTGVVADEINQAITEAANDNPDIPSSPPSGSSWSEFLSQEALTALQGMNFTELLNTNLGLQIPDLPCDGETISTPLEELQNYTWPLQNPGGAESESGNGQGFMMNSPATNADQDYFSKDIAGLGLGASGASVPSPSALEMIKSVQGGVDLYNGSQNTSIPLYTLQANDIAVPISLSSSNNGLKVNDLGSLVGQNWNLNAGGMVSRMVKGLPDEFDGTTYGRGVGRRYILTPRLEIPSNMGLKIKFPGSKDNPLCDFPEQKIKTGFEIFTEPFPNGEIKATWTPLEPTLINFSIYINIPINLPLIPIQLFVEAGFKYGFTPNETLGNIDYVENGKGYLHLDGPNQISTLATSVQLDHLNNIHPARWQDDATFLNDVALKWKTWIDAILFNNTYETDRQDTEPDEFYFTAGNYSGKFYLDRSGNPVLFPEITGLQISNPIIENGNIVAFTIQTPDGMKYTYGNLLSGGLDNVDFTTNTNYTLPNFYTYPEIEDTRTHFDKAVLDLAQIVVQPFLGPKKTLTYGNTYDRNYKIMDAPHYSSAWHLVKIESLLTFEEVDFTYESRNLRYYADKSYSHTFPNFNIVQNQFVTNLNDELNPRLNPTDNEGTKWQNGRAEFVYNVTETSLRRWHLTQINTQSKRAEKIEFDYEIPRGEMVGDYLCNEIRVEKNNKLYRGWKLDYKAISGSDNEPRCTLENPPDDNVPIDINEETKFNLGDIYDMKWFEYHKYFFINFSIGCFTLPIRIAFPIPYTEYLDKEFGHKSHLTEYGSLMEIRALNNFHPSWHYDAAAESAIFNAESKRTFLCAVKGLDNKNQPYPFVTFINYKGNLGSLPKRYSMNQDLFGYYNPNTSGSPFPPITYTAIGASANTITASISGAANHFGFFNEDANGNMVDGQAEPIGSIYAEIGALSSIELASGGKISYEYQLNVLPENQATGTPSKPGAGVRVRQMTEAPSGSPARITDYLYEDPTEVITPMRIDQTPYNYYYKDLEEKVVVTSSSQNRLFPNKNNHVGYKKVTEMWGKGSDDTELEIGSIVHTFTTPEYFWIKSNFGQDCFGLQERVECSIELNFNCTDLTSIPISPGLYDPNLPASLAFPTNFKYQNWLLGLETRNEVFNADGSLRQNTVNTYERYPEFYPPPNKLKYLSSSMYQYNYPGSFLDNYFYRQIQEYAPYGGIITPLIGYIGDLYNLVAGSILVHPFKYIERNYFFCEIVLETGNVRLSNSRTINFLLESGENWIDVDYDYNSENPYISKKIGTSYKNSPYTEVINIFAYESTPETSEFDLAVIDHSTSTPSGYLNEIGFMIPVASKSTINGTVVGSSFTALTLDGASRVVPLSNWTWREGTMSLAGVFEEYDDEGKPTKYKLAKHGTTPTFFDEIVLEWTDQLQLLKRTYKDLTTTYDYGNYFELLSVTDPNNIITEYSYDPRWRLKTTKTQNDRQEITYNYNIEPGNNWVKTEVKFTDQLHPNQETTQYLDGFGKPLSIIRDNDGALLNKILYDDFFRTVAEFNITTDWTTIQYEKSPLSRQTTVTDAVGNTTISEIRESDEFFQQTWVKDPNLHETETHIDGLGRRKLTVSGEGTLAAQNGTLGKGRTEYRYDAFGRLEEIANPNGELYTYNYNEIDRVISKKVPGWSTPQEFWWDIAFRPIATKDVNDIVTLFKYDDYNRLTHVYRAPEGISLGNADAIFSETEFYVNMQEENLLLYNKYNDYTADGDTWLDETTESVLVYDPMIPGGKIDGDKHTTFTYDDIGRPTNISQTYSTLNGILNGAPVVSNSTYSDAGLVETQFTNVGSVSTSYIFDYDDVLRPTIITLNINGHSKVLSKLSYNEKDLVALKLLGEAPATEGFLQEVDYGYDKAGKLIFINTPSQMECFIGETTCEFQKEFCVDIVNNPKIADNALATNCSAVTEIEIDDLIYTLNPSLFLNSIFDAPLLQEAIANALDYYGKFGEVSVDTYIEGTTVCFNVNVINTNATEIIIRLGECTDIVLELGECCYKTAPPPPLNVVQNSSVNPDLFFELITYDGLDISRIDMSSNCQIGGMRNEFTYDADHRVKTQFNIFFNPERIEGRYNTWHEYDYAGNITNLKRHGFVEKGSNGEPIFDMIDDLEYTYLNERLHEIEDYIVNTAGAKGVPSGVTTFGHDDQGNMTSGISSATYNLLNLPTSMTGTEGTMMLDYTYGGEKIKIDVAGGKKKAYIAGVEFVDEGSGFQTEAYYHNEGRVMLTTATPRFQYKIADHLGNTMVFFEDEDGDGEIVTEETMTNPDDLEVYQRHFYYPFGMNFEGIWNHDFEPEIPHNDYQYNGKELDKETGSNWSFYGFRMYDAAIGRFTGVDPIADQFAHVSTYNYAENSPIAHIDLHGLQKYWASSGEFLKQNGTDNSMRIVSSQNLDGLEGASNDEWLKQSTPAYEATPENEIAILKRWAHENRNTEREHVMSIFTKYIEAEDGWMSSGYFPVIIEGTTGKGPLAKAGSNAMVDPDLSKGLKGWTRSATIHTHPKGGWKDFSNEAPGFMTGGDIQWAVGNNTKLYLVPPSGPNMGMFDPKRYTNYVLKRMNRDNKTYNWNYRLKGRGGDYWLEPHLSPAREIIKNDLIKRVYIGSGN